MTNTNVDAQRSAKTLDVIHYYQTGESWSNDIMLPARYTNHTELSQYLDDGYYINRLYVYSK